MTHPRLASFCLLLVVAQGTARAQERASETFQVGIGLLQRGLHAEAAAQFERFLRDKPRDPLAREAWYRLGVCRLETRQTQAAVEALGKAAAGSADWKLLAETLYRLGHAHKELGQPEPAQAAFARLLDSQGLEHYLAAPAANARGECLRELGKKDEALAAFELAARSDRDAAGPYAAPSLYAAGFLLLDQKRSADAAQRFAAVVERYPRHPAAGECRYLQGEALLRAGDVEGATRALEQARAHGGEHAGPARAALARTRIEQARARHQRGEYEACARELEAMLGEELPKELRLVALELAVHARLDGKQVDLALQAADQALQASPAPDARQRLHYARAECRAERQQWEQALLDYAAAGNGPDAALAGDALYGEALALHKLGRFDDARQRCERLLQQDAGHRLAAAARFAVAENLFASKRWREAEAAYAAIAAEAPQARQAAFKRAWCQFLQGEHAASQVSFAALAGAARDAIAEESLSMEALAAHEAQDPQAALAAADRYRARHPQGAFLQRTERVAAAVLRGQGDLRAAAQRAAAAARAAATAEAGATADPAADLLQQADILLEAKSFEEAHELYARLEGRADAVGARALEGGAWCAFELGDDAACLRLLTQALAHPAVGERKPGLYELRATAHYRRERYDEAAATAREALREFPRHEKTPALRFVLGLALARGGKDQEAREVLRALAPSAARPDRLHYELAWVEKRLGDPAAARAAFEKVVATTQDEALAAEARLHAGELLLDEKQVEQALAALQQVSGRFAARAQYRIGSVLVEREAWAEAAAAFARSVEGELGELRGEALFLCGESWARAGERRQAIAPLRALLQEAPEHARSQAARLTLGQAELEGGDARRAATTLSDFTRRDNGQNKQDGARAWLYLGKALQASGGGSAAEAAFQQVTELTDTELAAEAQFRLGDARYQRGDRDGAVDALLKLSVLYGHEEWVAQGLWLAGKCYAESGQTDRARKLWSELVERFPNSKVANQARGKLQTGRGG